MHDRLTGAGSLVLPGDEAKNVLSTDDLSTTGSAGTVSVANLN